MAYIGRGLNRLGPVSAALFVLAGLLGPNLHGLAHVSHLAEEQATDCSFMGDGAHVERDLSQHEHGDCTLCSRTSLALDQLDEATAPAARKDAEESPTAPEASASIYAAIPGRGPPSA